MRKLGYMLEKAVNVSPKSIDTNSTIDNVSTTGSLLSGTTDKEFGSEMGDSFRQRIVDDKLDDGYSQGFQGGYSHNSDVMNRKYGYKNAVANGTFPVKNYSAFSQGFYQTGVVLAKHKQFSLLLPKKSKKSWF